MRNLIVIIILLQLTGCSSVISHIQKNNKIPVNSFPSGIANDPLLADQPPDIDLSQYKSVHLRSKRKTDTAIALAASGGGYRAANLTLGVLIGLERLQSQKLGGNLLQAVDYFSSVSGSGIAIGYYLQELHKYQQAGGNESFRLENTAAKIAAQNQNPLNMDLSSYLLFGKNRGLLLENKINQTLFSSGKNELRLSDIFIPKSSPAKVQLPYWAANATIFQNAAIFPFAPDILAKYHVTGYFHRNHRELLQDVFQLPVSVAVTASASLPIVIPPTTLISNGCAKECYLHLLDGGLGDNLGVYTALNLLMQDKSKNKVLIVVDASKATTEPYSSSMKAPGSTSLLKRLLDVDLDSNRQHLRPRINLLAQKLLGKNGTRIKVIYLDLDKFREVRHISTTLAMKRHDQQLLMKIGERLVAENRELRKLL